MLIPWNTDAPIYHFPWATIGLIVVNTLAYFGTLDAEDPEQWMLAFGDGLRPLEWITANFMHLGFLHLLGNMIFLWGFGLVIEGKLGWWRFLLVYLGLGVVECAVVQMCMQHMPGYALGAVGAIYGLLAMAIVWAPRNEMSCIGIFFLRPIRFEMSILAFGTLYVLMEVVTAWLDDFNLSSSMLHLAGAGPGFVLGLVLLKLNLVDCEGWDLLAVLAGREGNKARSERPVAKKQSKAQAETAQAEDDTLRRAALAQIDEHLARGNAAGAWALHAKMAAQLANWQLGETQLIGLIKALHASERWHDSIELMVDCLRRFPNRAVRMRLKLAQILIVHFNRPERALAVLGKIPAKDLDADLEKLRGQLVRRAESMLDEGEIELQGEDW